MRITTSGRVKSSWVESGRVESTQTLITSLLGWNCSGSIRAAPRVEPYIKVSHFVEGYAMVLSELDSCKVDRKSNLGLTYASIRVPQLFGGQDEV